MAQLADYVASGGTAPLAPTSMPNLAQPVTQSLQGMAPRQKMVLTIIGMTMLIPFFAVIGEALFNNGDVAALPAVLLPVGITWAVLHFRNQARRLEQEQWRRQMQMNQPYWPPVQAPVYQPAQPARPQAVLQPIQAPVYQTPPTPHEPPNTNPLGTAPGSVVEDETKRLPDPQG